MRHAVLCLLAVGLVVGAVWGQEPARPIKIGPDTTVLTGPLRPDGTVDYVAAMNAQLSKGVTPQNNAAVKLLEVFGPEFIHEDVRAATLKAMGTKLPQGGRYFVDWGEFQPDEADEFSRLDDDQSEFMKAPWHAKDHPQVAKWLSANLLPLTTAIEASKRPRFYLPLVLAKKDERLVDVLAYSLSGIGEHRGLCKALVIRAQLAAAEGRLDDAWTDIQAIYRLGNLAAQGPFVIDRLVGVSCIRIASSHGLASLATSQKLTAAQARKIIKEATQLRLPSSMADMGNYGERYFSLSLLQKLQYGPTSLMNDLESALSDPNMASWYGEENLKLNKFILSVIKSAKHRQSVDWSEVLRLDNRNADIQVRIMRIKNFAKRSKAIAELDKTARKEMAVFKDSWKELGSPTDVAEAKAFTVNAWWVYHAVSQLLGGSITRAAELEDIAVLHHKMAVVAVAMAGFRAENGKYPARLDELKPAWLKTIPQDVCSGKALIYKPSGKGYLLYSVGRNMRDDGGRWDEDNWTEENKDRADDIIIRVPPKP